MKAIEEAFCNSSITELFHHDYIIFDFQLTTVLFVAAYERGERQYNINFILQIICPLY